MSFLRQDFLSERVGDLITQYELSQLFIPVTDMQIDLKEGLLSELKPIMVAIKNLPKVITFPQYPSIAAYGDDVEEEWTYSLKILLNNTCESLLPSRALMRHLDYGIRMVSFTLGTRKQK